MAQESQNYPDGRPEYSGSPAFGYDAPAVQESYAVREAGQVAAGILPYIKPGMKVLDAGCGPGTITFGLAELAAPGEAIGIDLEPSMIEQAYRLAQARTISNVSFEIASISKLPYEDGTFDAVFTSSVLEHLSDPLQAVHELFRVTKSGGICEVVSTDWGDPMISPPDESVSQFFELFERGFNQYGASLNRGRHLRIMMRQAGFEVIDFAAMFGNNATPEGVRVMIGRLVEWINNVPLFQNAIDAGVIDEQGVKDMTTGMKQWAEMPDAFLAIARCEAIGRKP